jgi:hypothetical protein
MPIEQITPLPRFSDQDVLAPDFAGQVLAACRAIKPFLDDLDGIMR